MNFHTKMYVNRNPFPFYTAADDNAIFRRIYSHINKKCFFSSLSFSLYLIHSDSLSLSFFPSSPPPPASLFLYHQQSPFLCVICARVGVACYLNIPIVNMKIWLCECPRFKPKSCGVQWTRAKKSAKKGHP